MPLLGKRKYINEKIEQIINKLDSLGYNTENIKDVFYERSENEQNEENNITYEDEYNSSGSILPYRNKINKTLSLIEELIFKDSDNEETQNEMSNFNFIPEMLKETIMTQKQNENINQYDLMN